MNSVLEFSCQELLGTGSIRGLCEKLQNISSAAEAVSQAEPYAGPKGPTP